jgi:hypothetical protein
MSKEPSRYQLKYPHHLSWGRRIHVLKEGATVKDKTGRLYLVKQIIRSPIQGENPRLLLEAIDG